MASHVPERTRWAIVMAFAIAMAWVEAASVFYIRTVVDRIEPEDLLSYRWHPYAHDPSVDYTKETPTLVTFTLKDAPGNGTLLTVVETGFDKLPPERRMETFRMNTLGWESQTKKIAAHVET